MKLWIDAGATFPGTYAALASGMNLLSTPFPLDWVNNRAVALSSGMATARVPSDPPWPKAASENDSPRFPLPRILWRIWNVRELPMRMVCVPT